MHATVKKTLQILSSNCCILLIENVETIDLYCLLTLGIWHRLFNLASLDWDLKGNMQHINHLL